MRAFTELRGLVALMDRSNVDTDQIIPKQFLKRIERTGFGAYLFFDWRFDSDGKEKPDFELNADRFSGATVLVARRNFGCGSSREHAVWAIDDFGFQCVIAESFADIFYNNCFKNGVLPIALTPDQVDTIFKNCNSNESYHLKIELETQTVRDDFGFEAEFEIDEFRKYRLLNGLDDIDMTLQHLTEIEKFENERGYAPVGETK